MPAHPHPPQHDYLPPRSRHVHRKSRHVALLSNVPFLGRTGLVSRIQQVAAETPGAKLPSLLAFFKFWKWLRPYLRDVFRKPEPYQTYPAGSTGIFPVAAPPNDGPLRIAIAGDWGTGTFEAASVAKNMCDCKPHYSLHLGDVYYMGERGEVEENCLGKPAHDYDGVRWPLGSRGSFALMGNHEMYSGGQAYFFTFLPKLGLFAADGSVKDHQRASYFCLETDHWVILGLDTGYHSGGFPFFAGIPGINRIPRLNVDARFDEQMLAWLKQTIEMLQKKGSGEKSILLLTHHQPFSAFEPPFTKPAEQLAELGFLDGKEFVWLFGHEHRFAVYTLQTIATTLRAHPRCIGHGGMPVKVKNVQLPDPRILYFDPRTHPIDKDHPRTMVGFNGHVVAIFHDDQLTLEYRDILDNALLLTETFQPIGADTLQHSVSKPESSGLVEGLKV